MYVVPRSSQHMIKYHHVDFVIVRVPHGTYSQDFDIESCQPSFCSWPVLIYCSDSLSIDSKSCSDITCLCCSIEYNMSYVYHAMSAYFDRDNVALPGLASYFRAASEEERGHAQTLMDFQVCGLQTWRCWRGVVILYVVSLSGAVTILYVCVNMDAKRGLWI